MNYIVNTVEEFFVKLDKMQHDLDAFSQTLDNRSDRIPILLKKFEEGASSTVRSLGRRRRLQRSIR